MDSKHNPQSKTKAIKKSKKEEEKQLNKPKYSKC